MLTALEQKQQNPQYEESQREGEEKPNSFRIKKYSKLEILKQKFGSVIPRIKKRVSESLEDLDLQIKQKTIQDLLKQQNSLQINIKSTINHKKQKKLDFDLSKPADRALQFSYRMNQLRKQRELSFYTQHKNQSSMVQKQKDSLKKQIGKIVKLPPLKYAAKLQKNEYYSTISYDKLYQRKREQTILSKSLKNTQKYYRKKFMKELVLQMIDEAVGLVEKKRMFFSYKMRSNSKNIKIGKFIKYKIDENNESRLSQSLDPVTIRISGNKQSRIRQINNLYDINFKGQSSKIKINQNQDILSEEEDDEERDSDEDSEDESEEEDKQDNQNEESQGEGEQEEQQKQEQQQQGQEQKDQQSSENK